MTVTLTDGRVLVTRVDHPRGSPYRRMDWDELRALFRDTVAEALPEKTITDVVDLVAGLDGKSRPRNIATAMAADPKWLERDR